MEFHIKDHIKPDAKILLIKLRSIGDVVYNTAVYAPIKKHLPNAKLTVLVESASYDIVNNHPDVDEVLCFEKSSFLKQAKFYLNLIGKRYDVAIDMHEGTRGAVMCFLSRARFKIGNIFAKRSFLYNTKINFSDLNPKLPIDYQVALISKLGIPIKNPKPIIHISDAWRKNAHELLISKNYDPDDLYNESLKISKDIAENSNWHNKVIKEMIQFDGPVIADIIVDKEENCFPMIQSGSAHNEMVLNQSQKQDEKSAEKGKILV